MKRTKLVLPLAAAVVVAGGVTAGIVGASQSPSVPPLPTVSPGTSLPYLSDLPDSVHHRLLEWSGTAPEPTSDTVSVMAESGDCDRPMAIYLKEEGTKVSIGIIARKPADPRSPCSAIGIVQRMTVHLTAPFGHRALEHAKFD